MADVIVTTTVTTFDDCSGSSTRSSFNSGQTYVWVGRHYSGDYRPTGGWRFQVPDTIDPNDITEVKFKATAIVAGGSGSAFVAKVAAKASDTASFANDATNAPWPRGEAAHTAYGSVTWTATSLVDGARQTSPDITTQVVAALNATTASGGYRTIGVYLRGDTGANEVHTLAAIEHATYAEATLEIKVPEPENPTPSVSPVNATSTVSGPTLFERRDNISYDNGLAGYSADRYCDVYLPMGTPPDGGWPVVMYVHGGGFNSGNEDDLQAGGGANLRNDTLSTGTAIVSIRYKLTYWLLDVALGWTRPHMQQDMFAALKWIDTQSTFDLNSSRIIGVGYSAGGHLVLEAACYAEDPNIDDYTASGQGMAPGARPGQQDIFGTGPLGDRYDDFPDLIVTQGRTNVPKMIGVFTFGGAVSLSKIWDDATTTPDLQMNIYFGYKPSDSYIKEAVNEEGDIDAFIVGLAGSIYADRDATPPKFPIGVIYSTGDTSVPVSAGYTPLRSALSTASYRITGDDDKVLNPGVALSRYSYAGSGNNGGHDDLLATYNRPFYLTWLKSTLALTLPSTVTATLTVPTPTWSEESVATGGTAEPDAVTATTSIPSAGWGTDRVPTVVTATSTVPAPAWGAGWALTTVAGTASIGTPTWGAGWVPSVVAAVTAIAAQGGVGGGYTTPATIAATSTTPAPARGAGWVLTSVASTATVPAPSALGAGAAQVAVVTGTSTTPAPVWGAGWLLTGPAATSTVPAASFAAGGTATPTTITATTTMPGPTWGAGWIATQVAALAAVPVTAWVGRSTVSTVATTSTIPAPGWVARSTVATVATTTATSSITWGAGWVLTGPSTTTSIAAQGGVGGGYTTPATVGASATITTTTWGAGWVLTRPTATTSIGSPNFAGGATSYPTTVSASTAVPGSVWGAGWVLSRVQSTTSIPSAAWVTRTTVTAVATTTSTSSITWGAGWLLVGPTALVAISAQGGVSGGLTTPNSVSGVSAVPSPTWGSGNRPAVTAGAAGIPSFAWSSGLTVGQVAVLVQLESATWGAGWAPEQVEAATLIEAPVTGGGIEMIMAVMATVMIGFASTTRIGQTFSYFDGVNEYECEATYYDRTGPMEVMLEWIE